MPSITQPRSPDVQKPPRLTYDEYLQLQLDRSLQLKEHDPADRARYLIAAMARLVPARPGLRVLCVGCRNGHELDHLAGAGYADAVGIDLHSADPRILVMDMQRMTFGDREFDVVYASHSLEHALDPAAAAAEFLRLLRPGGHLVIEVPVMYGRRGADLWDLHSPEGIAALFPACETLWSEVSTQIGLASQQAARIILRKTGT